MPWGWAVWVVGRADRGTRVTVQELAQWVTIGGAVLNVAFFAYFLTQLRAAAGDRLALKDELIATLRAQLAGKDDLVKTTEARGAVANDRHELERTRLEHQIEDLKDQINSAIPESLKAVATGMAETLDSTQMQNVSSINADLRAALTKYSLIAPPQAQITSSWHEAIAKGELALGNVNEAARELDEANSDDWEVHFSRGVAHANSRMGRSSAFAALRAYNDAVAYFPADGLPDDRSRLHTYRAAMLKRLGRLDEAEAEVRLGLLYGRHKDNILDATYNLACIAAMKGDTELALAQIAKLTGAPKYIAQVFARQGTYFKNLVGNPTFDHLVTNSAAVRPRHRLPDEDVDPTRPGARRPRR